MSQEKVIVVSNDDGYFAEGIQALAAAVGDLGRVIVVAPDRDCSGISHKISIHTPLRLRKVGPDAFAVNGSPADCIHLAIHGVLEGRLPDLVISGINHGLNLGEDTYYSGTVAAAYEALLQEIPAIAVSSESYEGRHNFPDSCKAARLLARQALSGDDRFRQAVWNINVPLDRQHGFRLATLDNRSFKSSVVKRVDPRGREYFWLGPYYPEYDQAEGTDFAVLLKGYVALTPLKVEMTHSQLLRQLEVEPSFLSGEEF